MVCTASINYYKQIAIGELTKAYNLDVHTAEGWYLKQAHCTPSFKTEVQLVEVAPLLN